MKKYTPGGAFFENNMTSTIVFQSIGICSLNFYFFNKIRKAKIEKYFTQNNKIGAHNISI